MQSPPICPCCSNKLIHHLSHQRDYWFCRGCWQEMPLINAERLADSEQCAGDRPINQHDLKKDNQKHAKKTPALSCPLTSGANCQGNIR